MLKTDPELYGILLKLFSFLSLLSIQSSYKCWRHRSPVSYMVSIKVIYRKSLIKRFLTTESLFLVIHQVMMLVNTTRLYNVVIIIS